MSIIILSYVEFVAAGILNAPRLDPTSMSDAVDERAGDIDRPSAALSLIINS